MVNIQSNGKYTVECYICHKSHQKLRIYLRTFIHQYGSVLVFIVLVSTECSSMVILTYSLG